MKSNFKLVGNVYTSMETLKYIKENKCLKKFFNNKVVCLYNYFKYENFIIFIYYNLKIFL